MPVLLRFLLLRIGRLFLRNRQSLFGVFLESFWLLCSKQNCIYWHWLRFLFHLKSIEKDRCSFLLRVAEQALQIRYQWCPSFVRFEIGWWFWNPVFVFRQAISWGCFLDTSLRFFSRKWLFLRKHRGSLWASFLDDNSFFLRLGNRIQSLFRPCFLQGNEWDSRCRWDLSSLLNRMVIVVGACYTLNR